MNDEATAPKLEALDKMSLKEMFGPLVAPMESRPLCVIMGVVDEFKTKAVDNGQLVTLTGIFEAVEILSAVKVQSDLPAVVPTPPRQWNSRRCILPQNSEKQLLARLAESKKANDTAAVEFAMELTLTARNTVLGYEITYKHIVAPRLQDLDPLTTVRAEVQGILAAA